MFLRPTLTHIYTLTYTHTYINVHIYIHTYIYALTHTYIQTHTYNAEGYGEKHAFAMAFTVPVTLCWYVHVNIHVIGKIWGWIYVYMCVYDRMFFLN